MVYYCLSVVNMQNTMLAGYRFLSGFLLLFKKAYVSNYEYREVPIRLYKYAFRDFTHVTFLGVVNYGTEY